VPAPRQGYVGAREQARDDAGVFDSALVAVVVRGLVTQRQQVVAEPTRPRC
jgi:hypothetical protein